jgi:hypothetical protein
MEKVRPADEVRVFLWGWLLGATMIALWHFV